MNVYLYGAYGTGNLGDDVLLKAALERYPRSRVVSYGQPFLRTKIDYIDHFDFLADPLGYLRSGDELIFAGGGLFWAFSHAEDMRTLAKASVAAGAVPRVERIGAQGVHCNIEAATEMMSLSKSISVRDIESVRLLEDLGVTDRAFYEPDFALMLRDIPARNQRRKGSIRIGLNHSATPFFSDQEHRAKALSIYEKLATSFRGEVEFVYVPHTRHYRVLAQNDVVYGEYFWNASNGLITALPFPETVEDLLEVYAGLDAVIGWRYHLIALATRFGLAAAVLAQKGGHKYGAFAKQHSLPHIDFDLDITQIVESGKRFVHRVKAAKEDCSEVTPALLTL